MVDKISVVVPTRDRPSHLERCLASLRAELLPGDVLIVADSASGDADEVRHTAERHDARYVRCPLPGASRARNAGWRAAPHDLIAFIDDDVVVTAGWRAGIEQALLDDPDACFVTGRVDVSEDQQDNGAPVALVLHDAPFVIDARRVGALGGSGNLLVRRSALAAIDGFDELMGAGRWLRAAEDHDLVDRLLQLGVHGRHDPRMGALHDQWRDKGATARLAWAYGVGGGARLAKLIRTDRARARRATRDFVWDWGLAELGRDVRRRYKLGMLSDVLRLAGLACGFVAALRIPVRHGHFRSRR